MYLLDDLKNELLNTKNEIFCPVKGCECKFNKLDKQKHICKRHNIEIHNSTFVYLNDEDNILNTSKDEIDLLTSIKGTKRESRIQNERSEDALTWNVFRYLQQNNNKMLQLYLSETFRDDSDFIDIIYWSYSLKEKHTSTLLENARKEFGENSHGSEPDLIIITEMNVYFIEAKFTSDNNTSGDSKTKIRRINNQKKYLTGYNNFFDKIFNSSYEEIINAGYYELMRLWLLGNYSAQCENKSFYLVNLVCEDKEKTIETDFGKFIKNTKFFKRITWESIYACLLKNNCSTEIQKYFEKKTAGYINNKIQKAFSIK